MPACPPSQYPSFQSQVYLLLVLLQETHIRHQLLQQGQVLQGLACDSKGGLLVHDVRRQREAFDACPAPARLCCQQQFVEDL